MFAAIYFSGAILCFGFVLQMMMKMKPWNTWYQKRLVANQAVLPIPVVIIVHILTAIIVMGLFWWGYVGKMVYKIFTKSSNTKG